MAEYGNPPGEGPLRPGGKSVASVTTEEANLPNTPSPIVKAQRPALVMMRDLAEGNERVKEKRTEYLPMEPAEDPRMYSNRLQRSVFVNYVMRTAEGLTGMVFAKDPVLGEDVPVEIRGEPATDTSDKKEGHWENIDNAGTHGDVFIRERFQDGQIAGHGAILVDYPNTGGTQTAADERDTTFPIRPYWVPIPKDNIVSWRTTTINGRLVLTQLVLEECVMVPDGEYGEKEEKRYRIFRRDPAGVVTWTLVKVDENKAVIPLDGGTITNQDEIPISENKTSGRKSMFVSKPPLADLGFLNISHYQQDSDYKNSIHLTCVPLYLETGVDTEESGPVVIGPGVARRFSNPDADAKYVSHDGAALGAARQALEDTKSDIGALGVSMLAPQKRAAETATANRLDKNTESSALAVSARGLQDCVERALYFHARYLKKPSGGSISINRSFDDTTMDATTMSALADFAEKIDMPVRAILEELQKGGRFVDQDLDELEADIEANKVARDEMRRVEMEAKTAEMNAGKKPGEAAA